MRKVLSSLVVLWVAIVMAQTVYADNLVVNGGFDTGNIQPWTVSGNPDGVNIVGGDALTPQAGGFFAEFTALSDNPTTITQFIHTVPGQSYQLTYWFNYNFADEEDPVFRHIIFDSHDWIIPCIACGQNFTWTEELNFPTITATSELTKLSFSIGVSTPGQIFALDSISVQPVGQPIPEPSTLVLMGTSLLGGLRVLQRRNILG